MFDVFLSGYVYEPTAMVKSLTIVISLYINLLQCSCKQLLVYHSMVRKVTHTLLQDSPVGILFQEFIVYLILLQNYAPIITSNCETFAQFAELLDWFDKVNKSFHEDDQEIIKKEEDSELAWPQVNNAFTVTTKAKSKIDVEMGNEKEAVAEEKPKPSQQEQQDSLANFVGTKFFCL